MPSTQTRAIEPSTLYLANTVLLVSTRGPHSKVNLAPFSSLWALGDHLVLGISSASRTGLNLLAGSDLVVNVPGDEQLAAVERIAQVTGRAPGPTDGPDRAEHEPDKFARAGLTPRASEVVAAPRVAECPLQIEAQVAEITPVDDWFLVVRARSVRVHAADRVLDGSGARIDHASWRPLLFSFRHYRRLGEDLGASVRARRSA